MDKLKKEFSFLSSNRFWVMVIGAFAIYAQTKGWIGTPEMALITTLSGGFVGVRTIDRTVDKLSKKEPVSADDTTK